MEQQLVVFNGGLQTKVSPHLADPNTAVQCANVDLEKGSLVPFSKWVDRELVTVTGTKAIFHNDTVISNADVAEDRSYTLFGNRLYRS